MKKWRYVGDDARDVLYPRAFRVEPGDIVEAEENPDPVRFEPITTKKEKE